MRSLVRVLDNQAEIIMCLLYKGLDQKKSRDLTEGTLTRLLFFHDLFLCKWSTSKAASTGKKKESLNSTAWSI